MCFVFCPDTPPEKATSAGSRGAVGNQYIAYKDNPNEFALGLKDATCKEPCCCLLSGIGAPCGFTACWARTKVLNTYYNGIDDFVCCQGYFGTCCCCFNPADHCIGGYCGLWIEGFCCPVLSVSIARLHLMDSKRIHPDPCDWQIIACSNCLQCAACIVDIVAIFVEQLREAACILSIIADLTALSVAGCMGAQVYHETKLGKSGVDTQAVEVHQVTPPVAVADPTGPPPSAPTKDDNPSKDAPVAEELIRS